MTKKAYAEKRLKRRSPRFHTGKKKEMRECLRCGGKFMSDGPGNRICANCKKTEEWHYGEPDLDFGKDY